jgi:predicted nucleic acid-binding protein
LTLVVDASVAVHWTLETPLTPLALGVLRSDHDLIAPDFIVAETVNALAFEVRKQPGLTPRVRDGIEFLPRWFAELVPAVGLRAAALTYAMDFPHSAYDCFYLALAVTRGLRLVTADDHFVRKAAANGFGGTAICLQDWLP